MEKGFTITYEYGENLYVNTTNRCNFNCEFCLRHNGRGGSLQRRKSWRTSKAGTSQNTSSWFSAASANPATASTISAG